LSNILLLEDDPNLAKTLIEYLVFHGYEVDWARHGEEAIDLSYEKRYALYLFDVNVPLLNGVDLLASLREADDFTPTIMISAQIDVASVTKGFIAGADDYVKKPFDPEELLVRIKAKTAALKKSITFKDYTFETQSGEVFYKGAPFYMGEVQKAIFKTLVQHYPNPASKETLMDCLDKPTDLALRVNITKLKKSINLEIKVVRGVGYKIL